MTLKNTGSRSVVQHGLSRDVIRQEVVSAHFSIELDGNMFQHANRKHDRESSRQARHEEKIRRRAERKAERQQDD